MPEDTQSATETQPSGAPPQLVLAPDADWDTLIDVLAEVAARNAAREAAATDPPTA